MKISSGYWTGVVMVVTAAACYGIMSPVLKLAYEHAYTFQQITVHQAGIGAALLWILVLLRPNSWNKLEFGLRHWAALAFTGIFGLSMTTVLYNQTLERLDASFSIVLLFQFMWITILLESLRNRKWPTKWQWAAIVMAMAGTVLAAGLLQNNLRDMDWAGVGYGLASAFSYSLFLFLAGRVAPGYDPVFKSALMMSFGFIVILIMYGSATFQGSAGLQWKLMGWGFALGLLGQVMPTVFFNAGIPRVGSGLASMLGATELPFAVISAWLILGEPITLTGTGGILLILGGIVVAEYGARLRRQAA
ncbi:threonine/homoserine efflux transporter RhtA [Paenibacillus sp. BK033]|uniref:EamA family transporter n=1 Tax=Paenibacillus sp. BK033 TaxID=2512133 RepID=UPI0010444D1B|nr:DMT family transporter [Paenibacillus sp. BK033]TCM90941.1 threonine/homoserine efflux transporter RhtA [Paenibacillus sp. BK033]